VSQYPSITLSDVYAALAYYHAHLEEIRQQIQEHEAFARELQSKTPSLVK
jgi:prefoldin subunit 5